MRPSDDAAPAPTDTPYADLTPHTVLDALDAVGLPGDGRILQLNSYENRVFQVHLDPDADTDADLPPIVVAKFYRAGRWTNDQILEEHAFAAELKADEVPAVAPLTLRAAPLSGSGPENTTPAQVLGEPPTLACWRHWRYAVTPRCGGRAPELEDPLTLEWIGRFLARLHTVGQRQPFAHRRRLWGTVDTRAEVEWLLRSDLLPPSTLGGWHHAARQALEAVDAAFHHHGPPDLLRIHGDCHIGNLLWTDSGPHFVDLDDAVTGPAVQDLWMLLGGDRHEMQRQLGALLDGYETLREFDRRELALIEPLRTLRLIRHSVWIARRWNDPAFPIAFPAFESPSYWDQQATLLREQVEAMRGEPLVA